MVRWGVLAVLVTALSLTGCGADYAYVSNRGSGAFFKVPSSWRVYGEPEVLKAQDASLSDEEADDLADALWVRGFDSASDPAPEHVVNAAATAPRGLADVREIPARDRDTLDYAALRQIGFPLRDPSTGDAIDPLTYESFDPDGPIKVLDYDDGQDDGSLGALSLSHGLRGIRLRTRIALDDQPPIIVEQINVVDAPTETRYSFVLGCTRDCWEANEHVIETVADSWTLEQRT
jgi:hypothetical protein